MAREYMITDVYEHGEREPFRAPEGGWKLHSVIYRPFAISHDMDHESDHVINGTPSAVWEREIAVEEEKGEPK